MKVESALKRAIGQCNDTDAEVSIHCVGPGQSQLGFFVTWSDESAFYQAGIIRPTLKEALEDLLEALSKADRSEYKRGSQEISGIVL